MATNDIFLGVRSVVQWVHHAAAVERALGDGARRSNYTQPNSTYTRRTAHGGGVEVGRELQLFGREERGPARRKTGEPCSRGDLGWTHARAKPGEDTTQKASSPEVLQPCRRCMVFVWIVKRVQHLSRYLSIPSARQKVACMLLHKYEELYTSIIPKRRRCSSTCWSGAY